MGEVAGELAGPPGFDGPGGFDLSAFGLGAPGGIVDEDDDEDEDDEDDEDEDDDQTGGLRVLPPSGV